MSFRGRPLAREIALVLAFKALAIAVIWAAFFGPGARPDVDGAVLGRHLGAPAGRAR